MALNPSVENISKQYVYNLIQNLRLTDKNVTIVSPPQPIIPTSSDDLWNKMNAIPPSAVLSELTDVNDFYSEYSAILPNLIPQIDDDALKSILTDDYDSWVTFKKNNVGKYKSLLEEFKAFVDSSGLDEFKAESAEANFEKIGQDPVMLALAALNKNTSPENYLNGKPIYIPNIDQLKSVIKSAPSLSFSFKNTAFSSSTDSFWSSNFYSGGLFDWFSRSSDVSSQTLQNIHNAEIDVTVTFDNFANFTIERGGWYKSNVMALAYQTKDNTVWSHETPNWNTAFGPNGSFTRIATNIIVVDGVHISATFTNSNFSSKDASDVRSAVSYGFWPFFGDSTSTSSWNYSMVSTDTSKFTVTSNCEKGNPQYLGIVHESVKDAFGGPN